MEVDDGKGGKFTFSFSGSLDNTQLSKFNQIVDLVKTILKQKTSNYQKEIQYSEKFAV